MRKKKRRYDTGGVKGPSARRWLRDLSVSTPWRDTESTTCRNVTCANEAAPDGLSHGFCESCWNSKVRVLPGTPTRAPAHARHAAGMAAPADAVTPA